MIIAVPKARILENFMSMPRFTRISALKKSDKVIKIAIKV